MEFQFPSRRQDTVSDLTQIKTQSRPALVSGRAVLDKFWSVRSICRQQWRLVARDTPLIGPQDF